MQSGQRVYAKPAKGVSFRKPDGQVINPDGEEVIYDSFWLRRQNDGDVTLTEVKKKTASAS